MFTTNKWKHNFNICNDNASQIKVNINLQRALTDFRSNVMIATCNLKFIKPTQVGLG